MGNSFGKDLEIDDGCIMTNIVEYMQGDDLCAFMNTHRKIKEICDKIELNGFIIEDSFPIFERGNNNNNKRITIVPHIKNRDIIYHKLIIGIHKPILNLQFIGWKLRSIVIPPSVQTIGDDFCKDCTTLVHVSGMENVQNVGNNFCYGCISLTFVSCIENIKNVGKNFCHGCTSLQTKDCTTNAIYLPSQSEKKFTTDPIDWMIISSSFGCYKLFIWDQIKIVQLIQLSAQFAIVATQTQHRKFSNAK